MELREAFLNPPANAGPWKSAGFRGGDINVSAAQADWSTARGEGFSGLVTGFGAPAFGARLSAEQWARVNSFATPEFFSSYASVLKVARDLGLSVESTFGSCWPSGGGFAITPELAAVELTLSIQPMPGGAVNPRLEIPSQPKRFGAFLRMFGPPPPGQELPRGWAERLAARSKIVAVLAVRGSSPDVLPMNRAILSPQDHWGTVMKSGELQPDSTLDITHLLAPDGRLRWQAPPGTWQVFVFRQVASDMQISCGAGQGPQLVANAFDRNAFDAHAKRAFENGIKDLEPYFGNTLRSYFVDSSEYTSDIFWTDDFQAEFKRRRGYDLTPFLPFVFQPGWMAHPHQARYSRPMFDAPDVGARILSDYRLTIAELMTENFYQPFAQLMQSHGLESKIQAHGAPVDTLKVYGLATIPETEDLHVGTDPYFLKMARAAGDLYGRHLISSESLIWDSGGPSITPQMIKRHIDEFLIAGVNQVKIEASGGAPPPQSGQPPSPVAGLGAWIGPKLSTWPFILQLNRYLGRSQAVLQQGFNLVPVAVFKPDPTYVPASATDEPKTEPAPSFVTGLTAAGYDYDQISDDGIVASKVVGRHLITPGGTSFDALVLPATEAMRTETADALKNFAASGLPIFFVDKSPLHYAGFLDRKRRDDQVRGDMQTAIACGARIISDGRISAALRSAGVEANLEFLAGSVAFIEKAIADWRVYLIRNSMAAAQEVSFNTHARGGAEIWDAWNGQVQKLAESTDGSLSRVSFSMQPYQTLMVVFSPRIPSHAPEESDFSAALRQRPSPVTEVGTEGWQLHASGQGAGGRAIDVTMQLPHLVDWTTLDSLRDLSGHGVYTTSMTIDPDWLKPNREMRMDLGVLSDGGSLTINGHQVMLPAEPPYSADISVYLKPGVNSVSIDIFNMPNNAFAASAPGLYGLRPSGLIGPVWLKTAPAAPAP